MTTSSKGQEIYNRIQKIYKRRRLVRLVNRNKTTSIDNHLLFHVFKLDFICSYEIHLLTLSQCTYDLTMVCLNTGLQINYKMGMTLIKHPQPPTT